MTKMATTFNSRVRWRSVLALAAGGALGFWVVNFAISLTPLAAQYRSALSIAYAPMLVQALLGGFVIGCVVSYVLVRFPNSLPGKSLVAKSVTLSAAALILTTGLVELAARSAASTVDPTRSFLIGLGINVLRFLALGLVIGWLGERHGHSTR